MNSVVLERLRRARGSPWPTPGQDRSRALRRLGVERVQLDDGAYERLEELRADAELRGQVEDALDSLTLLVAAAVELRVVLELLAAGIDADVRLVPARPDAAGKWLFVEVYPSNVHTPTPEDRAELELVQIVNQDVRIRADFDGRVYLTAGRGEDTCVVP